MGGSFPPRFVWLERNKLLTQSQASHLQSKNSLIFVLKTPKKPGKPETVMAKHLRRHRKYRPENVSWETKAVCKFKLLVKMTGQKLKSMAG